MKERSDALTLLERFLNLHKESGFSVEVAVRMIAIQGTIFEIIDPKLWDEAVADAKVGLIQSGLLREN